MFGTPGIRVITHPQFLIIVVRTPGGLRLEHTSIQGLSLYRAPIPFLFHVCGQEESTMGYGKERIMRFRPLVPFRSRLQARSGSDPFSAYRTEMDDLFQRFFEVDTTGRFNQLADFAPSVDVSETDTAIIIKADLPGVGEDDVHLELHDDLLTLKGERNEETEQGEGEDRRIVERSYGRFERVMRLPFTPDEGDVETDYKQGVLTVTVKKPQNDNGGPKKIPIRGKWV